MDWHVSIKRHGDGSPDRHSNIRVSQMERDAVASSLGQHFADGRLGLDEYEERVEAALTAHTWQELEPLLADLPASRTVSARPMAPPAGPSRRRSLHLAGGPLTTVLAVAAVGGLAIATGPLALLLLWPATAITRRAKDRESQSALVQVPAAPARRALAVTAVGGLAIATGPLALLLVWPAWRLTRPSAGSRVSAAHRLPPHAALSDY